MRQILSSIELGFEKNKDKKALSLNHCKRAKIVRLEWVGFRGRARIIAKEQKIKGHATKMVRFEWI